ncbi:MAG TPA: 2'-5' RNA ligase family protein [Actinomycetes bacterium]|nr:2'-5' RNA ligase family protein [Actinomycetes bacterium]
MLERTIGVAVAIPEPFGPELQGWREAFGDPLARAIPPHVTLLPPTVVADADLAAIEAHLCEVAGRSTAFPMHLRGTGTFRPVSPVVFVALVEGIAGCERLESAIRSGPLQRELSFYYHPHVTVAHQLADDALDEAFDKLAGYDARFVVDGFSLFEHGADEIWRPRLRFRFGGPR